MDQSRTFEGKVALITGAASGIGRATAVAFARAGARVIIGDVSHHGGEETLAAVHAVGGDGLFVPCDVSIPAEVEALVGSATRVYGHLDYGFNNAGIEGRLAPIAEYPADEWERVLAVNLSGIFHCMRYELRAMHGRKGAIVNTASILGTVGYPQAAAYSAAKHGVIGLTQAAALEYAAKGVRINALCPGFIDTPMMRRMGLIGNNEARSHELVALQPARRLGKPEEVAAAVLWLCSDAASFVNGHALVADGGYLAQ
jgi:NAD(P)-dependent dehydrogenase (short-subunit alcohol dehydrogenase family)